MKWWWVIWWGQKIARSACVGEARTDHRLCGDLGGRGAHGLARCQLAALVYARPLILAEGQRLLWWSILLETGRTFNLIVILALRATGDSKYPFYAGAGSMAVVLAGGSWLLGVHWGWGLTGVWIAYAADEWIRGLLILVSLGI